MKLNFFITICIALTGLTACQVVPLNGTANSPGGNFASGDLREVQKLSYRDDTMSPYYRYFQPTQQSRAIIVGSAYQADVSGCTFMQRYRIRTNADFQGSLNLFKYRAYEMGAGRVVVVKHEEIDAEESKVFVDDTFFVGTVGTALTNAEFFTILIGDLYDCPNRNKIN